MAANDQMLSSVNFSGFGKATELKSRLWFTVLALVVYRIGTYIPLSGINPDRLQQMFSQHAGGLLSMFDMISGGALGRMTIFALSIAPYITASIVVQLLATMVPSMEGMQKDSAGQKKLNQYTRYATILVSAAQAYGIAIGIQLQPGMAMDPGPMFLLTTVITLVGGTMFLMWLGEQITARGVGNGISLIIYSGIVAGLPHAAASFFELGRTGALSPFFMLAFLGFALVVIAAIAFVERAQRRLVVQYPKRQVGNRVTNATSSYLPLKVNAAGVVPTLFAASILSLPQIVTYFYNGQTSPEWVQWMQANFASGKPLFMLVYGALIFFFSFFCAAMYSKLGDRADDLRRAGGFIPGIRPGKNTVDYLDFIMTRLTVVGAIYITAVCLIPQLLVSNFAVPFAFGGTGLMIVVTVTMDTVAQISSHLMSHQYEGLIKKNSRLLRR